MAAAGGSPPTASGVARVSAAGGDIASHQELQQHFLSAAETSTAMVTKVGKRRGGRRMNSKHRALMGTKVSVLSGESGRAILPSR